jgi:succinate dehydrogenase / fumarate reductase, iron-sulfur subunit
LRNRIDRATFLRHAGVAALGVGAVATLGTVAAVTAIVPEKSAVRNNWVPLANLSELPPDEVTTVLLKYETRNGIYSQRVSSPVLVSRLGDELVCYKSACTHLGCTVRWDGRSDQFRCACHGGAFDRTGNVTAGPPPRPMDRYETKVDAGMLLVLV